MLKAPSLVNKGSSNVYQEQSLVDKGQSLPSAVFSRLIKSLVVSQFEYCNQLMINQSQSGLSSSEEQDEENHLNQKLLENYRKIKESIRKREPQSSKLSMASVERAIEQEEQKNLQTRMLLTEQQYSKARENNILLLKKLSEAEEYTQFLKFELEKAKRQKAEELAAMTEIIDKLHLEVQSSNAQKLRLFRQSNSQEVNALQKVVQNKEKEVSRLSLKVKSLELALEEKETSLQQCMREIDCLTQNLDRMKETQVGQGCVPTNGSQILELQQAKAAIQRLFSLLKNTEQYRSFFNYSKSSQDLAFLSEVAKFLPQKTDCSWKLTQKMREGGIDEKMLWTPASCYKAMLIIKGKYDHLSQPCIQEILFELNRLYLQRWEEQIAKVKEQHAQELHKIKTKNLQRYDEVVARKQIERLKKELQQTRFNKAGQSEELNLLKMIGDYEDQLRLKDRENRLLTQRLELLESQNLNYDKALYLEGALWLIDKVLDEISQFQEDFNSTVQSLQGRTNENGGEHDEILINQIAESFSQLSASLHEKLLSMKQSTLKKINSQKKYQDTERTQ